MIRECVAMSLSNIRSNRVRSFLTVLGILIGVTAVIALITTVSGVSGSLTSSFSSMGAGTLMVSVTGSDLKSGMTADDLAELTAMDEVDGPTPSVSLSARVSRGGSYETNISVSGKNAYYFRNNENLLTRGRSLNAVDEAQTSFVCWISPDMVESFFYGVDPVGESLYINGIPFLVSGLLSEDGDSSMASLMSGSADILIPYTTALKMNNASDVTSFTVYLADGTDSEAAADSIEATVYIDFTPDADTRYGMTAVVSTLDEEIIGEEAVEEEAPAEEEAVPGGKGGFEREFAPDGEDMPEDMMAFGGEQMGGGSGHVKE